MSFVKDYPACANIGGQISQDDDNDLTGVVGAVGNSGLSGLTSFIQLSSAVTIENGDTFSKILVEAKDSFGVKVNKEITTINGNISINDAENGIDLQDPNLRIRCVVKTLKCPNGKFIESFILLEKPSAVISDFDMPNEVKAVGSKAAFVRFGLIKVNTTVTINCDEDIQAFTGAQVGTFTGEEIEPGDTLVLDVLDDIDGTTVLDSTNKIVSNVSDFSEKDVVVDHDFSDATITPADLFALSGGNEIDSLSVIPKGNNVTISMGGGTAKIENGRSKNYGGKNNVPLNTSWIINNPSEVEINIIWDLK